jgi:hypothetical protein
MENIIENIRQAIENIDIIISEDQFEVYPDIKSNLISTISLIEDSQFSIAEKNLSYCFRLLREAPPKNEKVGIETLLLIDESYKQIKDFN